MMSEALDHTAFDMLHQQVPQPTPEPIDERRARIEARAKALLDAEFAARPPRNAWWTPEDAARRDRCFEQAEQEVALEMGVSVWAPRGMAVDATDWSVPAREGLRRAIAERDAARQFRDRAGEVARRSAERIAALEQELLSWRGLDDQIRTVRLEAARAGDFDTPLPYVLDSALRDRAICTDKLDHANAANKQLQAELRSAEQAVQNKERIISAFAVKLLSEHADALTEDLARVRDEYEQRRRMLLALTYLAPPQGNNQPIELSRKLHEALNHELPPLDHNYETLRPLVSEWARAF